MDRQRPELPGIPRHFELRGWTGYGSALAFVGLARLVSTTLPSQPPAPYYLSILLAALWGGRGPGLIAAVLASLSTAYYDLGTGGQFDLNAPDLLRLVIFFSLALITSELVASRRDTEEALRAAVEELEMLDRAKDEFVATITHDLRSPLTSIIGWSELLESRLRTADDEVRMGINSIIRSARVQSRLVDDLLEASRLRLGKVQMRSEPINLVELVEQVIDSFRLEGERHRIELRRDIEPGAVTLLGDPERLEQMLRNLVANALKFTPAGGEVSVVLKATSGRVRLEVADTGAGIPESVLPVVFDRFAQAGGSVPKGGLGLGLSIVRHIVELHRGTVEAFSEGEGKGAKFVVELPLDR